MYVTSATVERRNNPISTYYYVVCTVVQYGIRGSRKPSTFCLIRKAPSASARFIRHIILLSKAMM